MGIIRETNQLDEVCLSSSLGIKGTMPIFLSLMPLSQTKWSPYYGYQEVSITWSWHQSRSMAYKSPHTYKSPFKGYKNRIRTTPWIFRSPLIVRFVQCSISSSYRGIHTHAVMDSAHLQLTTFGGVMTVTVTSPPRPFIRRKLHGYLYRRFSHCRRDRFH